MNHNQFHLAKSKQFKGKCLYVKGINPKFTTIGLLKDAPTIYISRAFD